MSIRTKPDEDGIVFVTGKEHEYIVTYQCDDEVQTKKETGREIIRTMDMADCYGLSILGYVIKVDGDDCKPCVFHGTWSDGNDRLKMWIDDAVTGEVYDVGYGSDH